MKDVCALVLGAGQGKRIGASELGIPKVMFKVAGKPMIAYLINNLKQAEIEDIIVVVGYKREKVTEYFKDQVNYAVQEEQKGTGHATAMAKNQILGKYQSVFVCNGDNPLIKSSTIKHLVSVHLTQKPTITMLTARSNNISDFGYGRIIRDQQNRIVGIVEQKDCNEEQLKITEWNPAFYVFDVEWLFANLNRLSNRNLQQEYYLTDMIAMAVEQGRAIESYEVADTRELTGVNNLENLATVERYMKEL